MEIWTALFLVVIQTSAGFAASVLSQGARNVKNGAAYGGASAVGNWRTHRIRFDLSNTVALSAPPRLSR